MEDQHCFSICVTNVTKWSAHGYGPNFEGSPICIFGFCGVINCIVGLLLLRFRFLPCWSSVSTIKSKACGKVLKASAWGSWPTQLSCAECWANQAVCILCRQSTDQSCVCKPCSGLSMALTVPEGLCWLSLQVPSHRALGTSSSPSTCMTTTTRCVVHSLNPSPKTPLSLICVLVSSRLSLAQYAY